MSQTSDPSPSLSARLLKGGQPHWADRLGQIVWRQGERFRQLGRVDRRMARLAVNGPARLWRRIDRLDQRIDALCADQGAVAARLQGDRLPSQDESALRAEYDHLGLLLGRAARIDAQIEALQTRLPRLWGASLKASGTSRADLRAHLLRRKGRLAETAHALRRQHVELSAHLVEFR